MSFSSRKALPFSEEALLIIRCCSVAAFLLSLYLGITRVLDRSDMVGGCSGPESCASLLSGDWSSILGLPVGLIAASVHLVILACTLPPLQKKTKLHAQRVITFLASTALFAGVWYAFLMLKVEHSACTYCILIHLCGLMVFLVAIVHVYSGFQRGARLHLGSTIIPALLVTVGFAAAQSEGFNRAKLQPTKPSNTSQASSTSSLTTSLFPQTDFALFLDTSRLPYYGEPNAKNVLVALLDYDDPASLKFGQKLRSIADKYSWKIGVIFIPATLAAECNATIDPSLPKRSGSCLRAQANLAIWHTAPEKWKSYHNNLLEELNTAEEAAEKARKILGKQPFEQAVKSSENAQSLEECRNLLNTLSKLASADSSEPANSPDLPKPTAPASAPAQNVSTAGVFGLPMVVLKGHTIWIEKRRKPGKFGEKISDLYGITAD